MAGAGQAVSSWVPALSQLSPLPGALSALPPSVTPSAVHLVSWAADLCLQVGWYLPQMIL